MMDDGKVQDATHAWAEVFIENLGWVAFDVANNIDVDERYILLSAGCDYRDATPMNGFHFDSENDRVSNHIEIKKQKNGNINQ